MQSIGQLLIIMSNQKTTNSMIEIDTKNLDAKVQYKSNLNLMIDLHKHMSKPSNCHQLLYFFSDNVEITLDYDKNTTKFCWKHNNAWYLKRFKRTNVKCFFEICDKLYQYGILNEVSANMLLFIIDETDSDVK